MLKLPGGFHLDLPHDPQLYPHVNTGGTPES